MAGGGKTPFNNAKFFPVGPGSSRELVETSTINQVVKNMVSELFALEGHIINS